MSDLPRFLREIEIAAQAYAYGQSAGRTDLGLKARKPNFSWVDETAFTERAVKDEVQLWGLSALYDQMLAEGTHAKRYKDGTVTPS
jgi:hypothetical protein